jgi:hypothetical protein
MIYKKKIEDKIYKNYTFKAVKENYYLVIKENLLLIEGSFSVCANYIDIIEKQQLSKEFLFFKHKQATVSDYWEKYD